MARLYVLKYGYHLKDNQDLAVDTEDPPDEAANVVVNEKEEPGHESYAVLHNNLRARIGEWYRRKYGGLLKTDKAAFTELFTGVLDGAPPKPQRGQVLHCYSRHFFEARVKERFDQRYASLKRRAEYTGEAVLKAIAVQNLVTREAWDEETPAMQREVKLLWEAEYQRALKGWEASLANAPTRTPVELAASLDNAAYYLQPFVDAISERFGMTVSLLLCGPIGRQQGVRAINSVHAGKTLGVAPMKWPEWDKARFKEVETRMVEFGRECFTEQQCRARAVGVASNAGSTHQAEGSSQRGPGATDGGVASTSGERDSANDHSGTAGSERGGTGYGDDDHSGVGDGGQGGGQNGAGDDAQDGASDSAQDGAGDGVQDGAGDGGRGGGGGEGAGGGSQGGGGGEGAGGGSQGGGSGEGAEDPLAQAMQQRIEALWARTDRADWTGELVRGKEWGIVWARCVAGFFDFESAHGYSENRAQIPVAKRPRAMGEWLARGRQWDRFGQIGTMPIGDQNSEGSWVEGWWSYWVSLQPVERVYMGGALSQPNNADWEDLAKLNGKNGLLQVMALLLWWGDYVGDGADVFQFNDWTRAVQDVTWVLRQLETSGCITGEKVGVKRKRARAKAAEESAPAAKVVRRSTRSEKRDEGPQTRARAPAASAQKKTDSKKAAAADGKKRGTRRG
ncbi:hypothetical protein C8F04DRAFT_1277636 [Mycena alexandri]|uniref:Uncharacterized protein n=1 Tax=Mycena alexandri TaxID=1745969 RepID=A0AAD6S1B5_9AGAR|nr:hypothetical protein C8F04DRAFT_1277636 [Mycena alexandri]